MKNKEEVDYDEEDIDELLEETEGEEGSGLEIDNEEEEVPPIRKKIKIKPNLEIPKTMKSKIPVEEFIWKPISQQAFEGFQNTKTGEVIDAGEALRRTLCYAEEAARNSR